MKVESFLPAESFVGLRLEEAIEASWCEELRGELARRGFAATGAGYPRGYRDNDRLVFDDAALAARMFEQLAEALPGELVMEGERWQLVGLNPRFRACRYRGGQAFCVHRDGPYQPDEDTRSWLTVQLYLDDAARMSGGRTRFYADRDGRAQWAALEPRRGTVIVFDHRAWHDGEAVTAGEKQVLRSDAVYRRIAGTETGSGSGSETGSGSGSGSETASASAREVGRHRGYGWRVLAGRDGDVISSGRDGTVRRWRGGAEADAGERVAELARIAVASSSVMALAESSDGQLWCGTRGGELLRIERSEHTGRTGRKDRDDEQVVSVLGGLGAVLALVALPAGGVAVATSHGEVLELDGSGHLVRRRRAHSGWVWALAVRSEGTRNGSLGTVGSGIVGSGTIGSGLLSAGEDGELIEDGRCLASLGQPVRSLAVLGDGSVLAGCADGLVIRVDGSRRDLVRAHTAAVTALAVAADGRCWASASEDGIVKRWCGTELRWQAPTRGDFVTSVAFAADGALLATGYDGRVLRWPASVVSAVSVAAATSPRALATCSAAG